LAPSHSQPWYFTGEGNTIHVCCVKTTGILSKIKVFERLNRIETGVAICHLWIAALHYNRTIEFAIYDSVSVKIPKGYLYIVSVLIDNQ
jgi:hypothetical protein